MEEGVAKLSKNRKIVKLFWLNQDTKKNDKQYMYVGIHLIQRVKHLIGKNATGKKR